MLIQQNTSLPTVQEIDKINALLLIITQSTAAVALKKLPYYSLLQGRKILESKTDVIHTTELPNTLGTFVVAVTVDKSSTYYQALTLSRKIISKFEQKKHTILDTILLCRYSSEYTLWSNAINAALQAKNADMPNYKKTKSVKPFQWKKLRLHGNKSKIDLQVSSAIAYGNNLARKLSATPSNYLDIEQYIKQIESIARQNKFDITFYDKKWLRKKKAGAFLAVAKETGNQTAGIMRLRYTPKKTRKTTAPAAIIAGKGICYDTGGLSLKPTKYMLGMHEDMQGSAVALGTLVAINQLQFNRPVEVWLALAENLIGPNAYRPGDVVQAVSGDSIEIIDTDAEGRMVLADTLALASKLEPEVLIDLATLTGSCMNAIGDRFSGIFSNQETILPLLKQLGEESGERVWPFPLPYDYLDLLKSDIADIKQCSEQPLLDHILAALFLQKFVDPKKTWIHIDLSSSKTKEGLAQIPTSTTGFGVGFLIHLLYCASFWEVIKKHTA